MNRLLRTALFVVPLSLWHGCTCDELYNDSGEELIQMSPQCGDIGSAVSLTVVGGRAKKLSDTAEFGVGGVSVRGLRDYDASGDTWHLGLVVPSGATTGQVKVLTEPPTDGILFGVFTIPCPAAADAGPDSSTPDAANPDSGITDAGADATSDGGLASCWLETTGFHTGNNGCGLGTTAVAIVSDKVRLDPFGVNSIVDFTPMPGATSASGTGFTIFGVSNYDCTVSCLKGATPAETTISVMCSKAGGGTCTEAYAP